MRSKIDLVEYELSIRRIGCIHHVSVICLMDCRDFVPETQKGTLVSGFVGVVVIVVGLGEMHSID